MANIKPLAAKPNILSAPIRSFFRITFRLLVYLFVISYFLIALVYLHPNKEQVVGGKHLKLFSQLIESVPTEMFSKAFMAARLVPAHRTVGLRLPHPVPKQKILPPEIKSNLVDTTLNLDPINRQASPERPASAQASKAPGLDAIDTLPEQQLAKIQAVHILPAFKQLEVLKEEVAQNRELAAMREAEAILAELPSLLADLELAKNRALLENKHYILQFGAEWCLPCRQMEKGTFRNPAVVDALKKDYLLLHIDIEKFDGYNLKNTYQVSQIPSTLIFDKEGRLLSRKTGMLSAAAMLQFLKARKPPNQS